MKAAKAYMQHKHHHGVPPEDKTLRWTGPSWSTDEVEKYVRGKPGRCVVLVDGFIVDATEYLGEHVRATSIDLKLIIDDLLIAWWCSPAS
jgi:stearoyl-CoA desaturase (Delta-9 desaturase)